MPWTIPDKGEGDHNHQSILFQEYLDGLIEGLQGLNCVLWGCAVTGGADMTPAVAAGVVRSNGVLFLVSAGDVTIGAADGSNPRFDLIVVDSAGAKQVRAGTAAANPKPPARTANDVLLAVVYVPASDTSIETTKITDLRVMRNHAHPGHLSGLTLSNNGADAANDIDVAAGECTDEDSSHLMPLTATITKRIDAAWAVGSGNGGMNTGSVAANTWYEVHVIQRDDTGVVDVMFTTTANRATLPTNYTRSRRIGWVRTNATPAILAFTQRGDFFTLTTPINDVAASKATSQAAVTLTVPPNSIAKFRAGADMSTSVNANSALVFREMAEADTAPALGTGNISLGYWDLATGASGGHFWVRADGSSQIRHDADVAVGAFDISTYGWIDERRRTSPL